MRYPPIPQHEWSDDQKQVASTIAAGPRGEVRGPFVPLLYAPALASNVQELGETVRFRTGIPDALLEIVVLMTARTNDCPNIWESHSALAAKAGVARSIIAAIAERRRPEHLSPDEALVHAFSAQMLEDHKVTPATFDAIVSRWGKKGAMELAAISGYYAMLATVLNVAERPLVSPTSIPFGS